jgi:hypothetical protein
MRVIRNFKPRVLAGKKLGFDNHGGFSITLLLIAAMKKLAVA